MMLWSCQKCNSHHNAPKHVLRGLIVPCLDTKTKSKHLAMSSNMIIPKYLHALFLCKSLVCRYKSSLCLRCWWTNYLMVTLFLNYLKHVISNFVILIGFIYSNVGEPNIKGLQRKIQMNENISLMQTGKGASGGLSYLGWGSRQVHRWQSLCKAAEIKETSVTVTGLKRF